jgi:hypothetical protein
MPHERFAFDKSNRDACSSAAATSHDGLRKTGVKSHDRSGSWRLRASIVHTPIHLAAARASSG